jgi:glycosyl transferase family 25
MKEYFDKIYCINLNHRKDRWEESIKEFKKLGIENDVERFEACNLQPGIAGCTKSHYEIVKIAKQNNYKNILIFEDDFKVLTPNTDIVIANAMNQLKKHNINYDMFYLGGHIVGDEKLSYRIDDNLAILFACKTTHAYAIGSSAYDYILNSYDNIDWSDLHNWTQHENRLNIDYWYSTKLQRRNKTYGVYPCLFEQRDSFSDLMGKMSIFSMYERYNKILQNKK